MPKEEASNASRQLELAHQFKVRLLDAISSTLRLLITWGSLVLIFWIFFGTLDKFAGQTTLANIGISFLSDIRISEGLAYVLAGGGVAYGYSERKLRQRNIERLAERPRQLERKIDAKRTSSGLTVKGTTRPEDRP